MRLFQLAIVMSALCLGMGLAATSSSKAPAKSRASATAKKAPAPASSKGKAVAKAGAKGKKAPVTTWRNRQQSPTPDRYREIQQALVSKGYLKGDPNGVWDADSVSAMQHFQTDQKLPPTGKVTAASLIGLGLGAKSAGAAEAPALPGAPGPVPATSAPSSGAP